MELGPVGPPSVESPGEEGGGSSFDEPRISWLFQ